MLSRSLLGLFDGSGTAPPLDAGSRLALYKSSTSNAARDTARLKKDPQVMRDLARLDRAIAHARTPADLFKDPEAVRVLLTGLGLGDQAANAGIARQALLPDPAGKTSLANRLPDKRWLTAAKQLAFTKTGLDTLRSDVMRKTIAEGVVEYARVSGIQKQSRAVADAITVSKLADGKGPSVYEVLGNKVLRRVVQTVTGLPDQLAVQEIEAQARSVNALMKVADFGNAAKREKLIQRYLLTAQDPQADSSLESLIVKL
jgi:hypothetical protein